MTYIDLSFYIIIRNVFIDNHIVMEGTEIKMRSPMVYVDNVDINSAKEIESKKSTILKNLEKEKAKLLALAVSTPKDVTPEGENPIDYMKENIESIYDDICDLQYDLNTLERLEDIANDWKYGYYVHDMYDNCKSDEEIDKQMFPKDEHVSVEMNKETFTFAPNDVDICDAIKRAVDNIKFNDEISDFITDKYVIIENGKIFAEYNGNFLFKSKEDAFRAIEEKMDLRISDYISKSFNDTHPYFFDSVISTAKSLGYFDEQIEKFKTALDSFFADDKMSASNMENMNIIYETLKSVLLDKIYEECGIKVVTLKKLIDNR